MVYNYLKFKIFHIELAMDQIQIIVSPVFKTIILIIEIEPKIVLPINIVPSKHKLELPV